MEEGWVEVRSGEMVRAVGAPSLEFSRSSSGCRTRITKVFGICVSMCGGGEEVCVQ